MNINDELSRLRHADAETDKEMMEHFPPQWDMDAVYRKSIEKYRQQAGLPTAPAGAGHITVQRNRTRIIAAACLLLTIGIAGTVGWRIAVSRQQPPAVSEYTTATSAATLSTEGTSPASTALSAASSQTFTSAATGTSAAHTQKTTSSPSDAAESNVTQTTEGAEEETPAESSTETVSSAKTTASTVKTTASSVKTTAITSKSTTSAVSTTATAASDMCGAVTTSVSADSEPEVTDAPDMNHSNSNGEPVLEDGFTLSRDGASWICRCQLEKTAESNGPESVTVRRNGYTAEPAGNGWRILNSASGAEAQVQFFTEEITRGYPCSDYNPWPNYSGDVFVCCFMGTETAELLWNSGEYICILTTGAEYAFEFLDLVRSISAK